MEKLFQYETQLVKCFQSNYSIPKSNLLIEEMKIRWGNIDLVEINNTSLPFTLDQCKILSKPSSSRIFMRLKNKRPISKQKLFDGLGLSESTFDKALSELTKFDLIYKENNLYYRNVNFVFPNVIITGYEAKLYDYNKAFYQACINKEYVDYSYMVFPIDVAINIMNKHKEVIRSLNLGLIGVSKYNNQLLIEPIKRQPIKPYIRLMNLALSYKAIRI